MSVIIKSNNVASKSFGTTKMLGTTAQAEFDKYKARVMADGGVIKDEARTLAAFNLLFTSKMYGNMNTCVSGTFGVKTTGTDINKLYAIDGLDLTSVKFGTGSLPTLTAENNISFSTNAATVNGGMFTTANQLIVSKIGTFGYMTRLSEMKSGSKVIAGLSKHDDEINTAAIALISSGAGGGGADIQLNMQADPLSLTSYTPSPLITMNSGALAGYPAVTFTTMPELNKKVGYRNGVLTATSTGKTFSQITSETFYLDFGGAYYSNSKQFTNDTVRDFMCFSHATELQAAALSRFTA